MRLILDSDILIDQLKGTNTAVALLEAAISSGHELWSVTPVRTEVLRGSTPDDALATRRVLDLLDWLDIDTELADRAAVLVGPYQRSHAGISVVDALLAAAVERLGGRLLTRNVRHFPMIPGLEPAY